MINFIPPTDIKSISKQIQALEWQIKQDKNEKDKLIHQQALNQLNKRLKGR